MARHKKRPTFPPRREQTPEVVRICEEGIAHHKAGRLDEALNAYKRVLTLHPGNLNAIYWSGMLSWQVGKVAEAVRLLKIVAARMPGNAEVRYNLGCALQSAREPWAALAEYEAALRLNPTLAVAWENMGTVLNDLGARDEARTCFEKAVELIPPADLPHAAQVRYNLSQPLMSLGRWREGFDLYEHRFATPLFAPHYRPRSTPLWDGDPQALRDRRLLCHAEQGFGDVLMTLRFLPWLQAQGAHLSLEVHAPLVSLVSLNYSGATVVTAGTDVPVDLHVPLMSLPHRLKIETEEDLAYRFPTPYLWAPDPVTMPLPPAPEGVRLRVGFCWAGSADHNNDRNRSVRLELWRPVFELSRTVQFYSLQVGYDPVGVPCIPLGRMVRDFADTAALITQLDLVVTVDTSVAHLAGALGVPTWLLLPANPDWRWGMTGERTGWYLNARLFRQEHYGDWPGVMGRVATALAEWSPTTVGNRLR